MELTERTVNSGDAAEDKDIREIIRLEQERTTLLVECDLDTLNQLVPDNFTLTRPSGVTFTKREVLAALRSGNLIYESLHRECHDVTIYQNTASATGLDTVKGVFKGERMDGQYRFRNTYVQTDGRWQLVASVATLVEH